MATAHSASNASSRPFVTPVFRAQPANSAGRAASAASLTARRLQRRFARHLAERRMAERGLRSQREAPQ